MRKSIRVVVVTVLALGVALLVSVPASAATLDLVGESNLGGKGLNGEVATVGDTAIVGAGQRQSAGAFSGFSATVPCPKVSTKVVDLEDPSSPRVVNNIEHPEGVISMDVAAMKMDTPSFRGDLAAVALARCQFGPGDLAERGVAYYDVTNPREPELLGRYMADADRVKPEDLECDGKTLTRRCAQSQHAVSLVKRQDGKVLSLSTQPFAAGSNFDSGDLRIVDITNPKDPKQLGDWPEKFTFPGPAENNQPPGYDPDGAGPQPANSPAFSNNGCRGFDMGRAATGTGDGTKALFAYWDQGLFSLDLSDPQKPNRLGQWSYDRDDRSREGNAAYVESTTVGGRSLALMSDEDWIAPSTSLRIDGGADEPLAGSKFACEAIFTLFDPEDDAAIYRKPNSEVPGDMAYVGRGCPKGGTVTADDPYLADPKDKIAVVDDRTVTSRQGTLPGGPVGCQAVSKVKRAQEAGAKGIVVLRTNTSIPQAVSLDGNSQGLNIPVIQIDTGNATPLRDALCPTVVDGACTPGRTVSGAMVDKPGAWGGLHVLDVNDPAKPTHLAEYHTPAAKEFPVPDRGVYSIHHAIGGQGGLAYAAWNSAGLRVLDLAGGNPREIASFVPDDMADPSKDDANGIPASVPDKAFVVGVAETEKGQIVISDINSGLYVLSLRDDPPPPPPPSDDPPPPPTAAPCPAGTSAGTTCTPLPGGGRQITGTAGNDRIVGTSGNDVINAGGGNDVVLAGSGNDRVNGGAGNDRISGGAGNDALVGNAGLDVVVESGDVNFKLTDGRLQGLGSDGLSGIEGARLTGGARANTLDASAFSGNVVLDGQGGGDRLTGGKRHDRLTGGAGDDRISGGAGNDTLNGGRGNDRMNGDSGNDTLFGGSGNDTLFGGPGRDTLFGGPGRDQVRQ